MLRLIDLHSGRVRMTAPNERKMGTARESAAKTLKMSDIQKSGRNADEALRGLKLEELVVVPGLELVQSRR
jgi:hypothetical protein